jgi:membrane protein
MEKDSWMKSRFSFVKETWNYFSSFRPTRMASSLSYYFVFALIPVLMITLWVGNFIVDTGSWGTDILAKTNYFIPIQGSDFITTTFNQASHAVSNPLAAFIAAMLLVFLAAQAVGELKSALDEIWNVVGPKKENIMLPVKRFIVSLFAVLMFGTTFVVFVLVAGLFEKGFLSGVGTALGGVLAFIAPMLILFAVTVAGAMLAYQILPETTLPVIPRIKGALITGILLTIGNVVLGYYFTHGASLSTYGVAGSVVAVLLWLYYSSLIFLFGASSVWVFSERMKKSIDEQSAQE